MPRRSDVDTQEAPIGGTVVERVADRAAVDATTLAAVLVELNASLIGQHAALERASDYVTVDGTRAYRVDRAAWGSLVDHPFERDELADAARRAHTEQARLLFDSAAGVDNRFHPDDAGVVVGIDTAEEF